MKNIFKRLNNELVIIMIVSVLTMFLATPSVFSENPLVITLMIGLSCITALIDPKTPGITDDERNILKELKDLVVIIINSIKKEK